MPLSININTDRLLDDQQQLTAIRDGSAMRFLRERCEAAGLEVRADPAGHVFARWCPSSADPDLPAVGTGSVCAAPPEPDETADRFVGILGGLEAIRALQTAGFAPQHPIELIAFSRGCAEPDVSADAYRTWVELHAEPGDKLGKHQAAIGIVMGMPGRASYAFTVEGEAGHAGGVTMPDRRDALCAAAEAIHGIEQLARSSPSADLVATVGTLEVLPGSADAIPARVRFTLDLRDVDEANRDQIADAIHEDCNTLAHRRGVKMTSEKLHADPPIACDKAVIDAVEQACDRLDLRWWKMVSRTRHDPLYIAQAAPTGMILIPRRDEPATGVEVLAWTLAELACDGKQP